MMTAIAAQPYASSPEHLLDELHWIELLIRREIARRRSSGPGDQVPFRGMYISDREADLLASDAPAEIAAHGGEDELRATLDERRSASQKSGVPLAIPQLARLFGLTPFEERVALVALAPEVDGKFGVLYAYLQDDISRRRPSVDLALRLLCESPAERIRALRSFSHQESLLRMRILRLLDRPDEPIRDHAIAVDGSIVDFLLGTGSLHPDIAATLHLEPAPRALDDLRWSHSLKQQLLDTIRHFLGSGARHRMVFQFHGPAGTGKHALASSLCREIGLPLLRLDMREAIGRFADFESGVRTLFRQALLGQAALFLENFDQVTGNEERSASQRNAISHAIGELSGLTFIGTETPWTPDREFQQHVCVAVELPAPDLGERSELWKSMAAERAVGGVKFAPSIDWDALSAKFRITPGEMSSAIETAIGAARLHNPRAVTVSSLDLHRGMHAQSHRKLSALARKLTPHYSWQDIVLPPNALSQLHELCAHIKHRRTVMVDWGFGKKLSLGKGLCALFCGQSGVGKTMAVDIVASELQLEVFKIDLANVVSKYIGETEKNLAKIFAEAESSNAILFFDEADALFGKRSEVKDAHDRYANIEINYLLQRMEEFEGLVILATNLRKNIDEGFFRRMQFVVEFPFPDAAHRYRIWKQHFPEAAPAADDIDFSYLATKFNMAGGNIKNVAVNAAFMAAADGGTIRMEHLIRATKREYEKMGRLCTDQEFAPHHGLPAPAGAR